MKKYWNKKIEGIIHTPRVWKNQIRPDPTDRGENWIVTGNGVNWLYGLYELIEDNFPKDAILTEIGSYSGVSTSLFACVCSHVYAIDPWCNYNDIHSSMIFEAEHEFDKRMVDYPNVQKIKAKSMDIVNQFPDESLDVVYIDGDHSYESVLNDIQSWMPKICKNGLLCGHDYIENDIQKALKDVFPSHEFKPYWDTSWCIKIN